MDKPRYNMQKFYTIYTFYTAKFKIDSMEE